MKGSWFTDSKMLNRKSQAVESQGSGAEVWSSVMKAAGLTSLGTRVYSQRTGSPLVPASTPALCTWHPGAEPGSAGLSQNSPWDCK